MKIKQLLLTTDFSENARKTYSCATALARKFDATLHLAHFAGVAPAMMLGSSDECYYETRRKALQLEAKEHPVLEGYGVLPHLEAYRWTPERLRSLEQAHDIDLVVMGTHGRTGGRYFVLGSFAERVVRNSSVPVLVHRQSNGRPEFEPKEIIVPFDFSTSSEAILPTVRFLSANFDCRFRFVYVYEPPPEKHFPVLEAVREFLRQAPKKPVEDRFAQLADNVAGVNAALETCHGIPAVEIVNRVREGNADLVLMGTHGVLGSVAQNVTREAPCSVLTVPLQVGLHETTAAEDAIGTTQ